MAVFIAILDGVSLRIIGPERVAVTGPNGSGKSTLLRVVAGRITPSGGAVRRIPDAEVAYLGQEADGLAGTVLDSFRRAHPDMEPSAARHALARLLFSDEAALQHVDTLSGGDRRGAGGAAGIDGLATTKRSNPPRPGHRPAGIRRRSQ